MTYRIGVELELLAPAGTTRADLAERVAEALLPERFDVEGDVEAGNRRRYDAGHGTERDGEVDRIPLRQLGGGGLYRDDHAGSDRLVVHASDLAHAEPDRFQGGRGLLLAPADDVGRRYPHER